jgi:myo-inositol-1(or 4)-monophosphatase
MTMLNIIKTATSAAKHFILENGEKSGDYTGSLNPFGDRTLVLDKLAEDEIISILQGSGENFAILTEESGLIRGERLPEYLAIVDPIDGSENLKRGIPLVSIGIAIVPYKETMTSDDAEISVIESVFADERFIAVKGEGVTRNGRRVQAAPPVELGNAVISYDTKKTGDSEFLSSSLRTLGAVHDIRRTATNLLDLCWTAAGFLDGMVDLRNMLPIIHLSGTHMVFEAGGFVIDSQGKRFCSEIVQSSVMNFVAASSEELAKQILRTFNGF